MAHKFINEIAPGETINDIYLLNSPILRSTSRGDLYIAMYLSDRTGQLNSRMWQATEDIYNSLGKTGFVHIQGKSELYQNKLQIIVNNIAIISPEKINSEDFMPRTKKDTDRLFSEIKEILTTIKNPQIKSLIEEYLNDDELMVGFCAAPAAMKMHHGYLGGLIEHTHNMLKAAQALLPLYPGLQQDLVIAGIFLHDLGKTQELEYDTGFSYSNSGQLIGHIVQGMIMLNQKANNLASKNTRIDKNLLDTLGHIIISHHGKYEFGSPKLPATPEAFMVCYLDDLDAKLNQVTNAVENDPGDSDWTDWKNSLQTRLFRKRIE